jgi:4-amino-4-deoxy-L-arabinose transferase-like glycosyltransferase
MRPARAMSDLRFRMILAALLALGVGLVAWATNYGIGVTPDSLMYVDGAVSMAAGRGYFYPGEGDQWLPITHFPPAYSATLVPLIVGGLDPLAAARVLALLLLAANALLVAYATHRYTHSRGATLMVATIMATSPQLLLINTAAWSEQEFILFIGAALLALSMYLQGDGRWSLLAAAVCAALACLCRVAGVGLVATGLLAIVWLGSKPWWSRLGDASIFALVSTTPSAAWVVRNVSVSGLATDRAVQPDKLSFEHLQALAATISSWWLPSVDRVKFIPGQDALTAAATCGVILFLGYGVVRWVVPTIRGRRTLVQTPVLFLLFSVIYIVTVLLGIGFWDRDITLDDRILVPAFVTFLIPSAYVLHIVVRSSVGRLARSVGLVFALGVVLTSLASGLALAQYFHREGRGYNSPNWQYPSIDRAISRIDPKIPVLSNQTAAVRFLMKRSAREASPQGLRQTLQTSGEAIVIYFDNPRTFTPRHEASVRLPPDTPERREILLGQVSASLLVRERNAWLYLVRPPIGPPFR